MPGIGIIVALIMFCILVLVHEGGHFFMAKAVGIKVNEFAVGMGPAIFKKQKGETLYSFRVFPIGGFCAMETSEGEEEGVILPRSFEAARPLHRALVLLAGPAMNLIIAVVILGGVALYMGMPTNSIGNFTKDSNANAAGLAKGDEIISIADKKIESWNDIGNTISMQKAEIVKITVLRDDEEKTFDVRLSTDKESGRKMIGIMPAMSRNPAKAAIFGVQASYDITVSMIKTIGQLFTHEISPKELTGVVGITVVVGDAINYGFVYVANFAALISINLGIVNLLPFPALDGGRLLFLAIRQFTGKAITDEIEGKIHFAGIVLLFGLMIYVTWQDIFRFIIK